MDKFLIKKPNPGHEGNVSPQERARQYQGIYYADGKKTILLSMQCSFKTNYAFRKRDIAVCHAFPYENTVYY